MEPEREHR
jgi:hypothetical protein